VADKPKISIPDLVELFKRSAADEELPDASRKLAARMSLAMRYMGMIADELARESARRRKLVEVVSVLEKQLAELGGHVLELRGAAPGGGAPGGGAPAAPPVAAPGGAPAKEAPPAQEGEEAAPHFDDDEAIVAEAERQVQAELDELERQAAEGGGAKVTPLRQHTPKTATPTAGGET
jgi:hypothetical protein